MKVKAGTSVWTYRMKYPTVQSNEEKTSSKCVRKGLVELSTMSNGSTSLEEPIRPDHRHLFGDGWLGHPILEVLLECSKFRQCGERVIYPVVKFQQSHIGHTVGESA